MVQTYFEIGRMIVEEEQGGSERAEYGKGLLNSVAKKLTTEFGKGFSVTNLKQMRQFYLIYAQSPIVKAVSCHSEKSQTVSDEFNPNW
ncbi:DUF1016 domain-containing protein [Pasteurellaceae bacterium UScroc12]|nr:DUF1016 domain-containing protein [Pasteurellaceae bacterium UScroc12]